MSLNRSPRRKNHSLLIVVLILMMGAISFVAKLAWDEYQFNRASEKLPAVKAIFGELRQVARAESVGDVSVSVNEYATALWQSYKGVGDCSAIRTHFDSEASRLGFKFSGESSSYVGPGFEYRKGEFEVRVICRATEESYSLGVNWYGLDR